MPLDNTNIPEMEAHVESLNDYYVENGLTQRIAMVKIPRCLIFPVDNAEVLTNYNNLSEAAQREYYENWIESLDSYPPV